MDEDERVRFKTFRWIQCLLFIGCWLSLWANADSHIDVTVETGLVHISGDIEARVDRASAWAVLTDYNHWADFIPDLTLSLVLSRPGEPLRIGQRAAVPWLPNFPLAVIFAVEEDKGNSIRLQRIAGNVRGLQAEWSIVGSKPVQIVYRATVDPGFPLPPQATMELFREDTRRQLEALASEMARRARKVPTSP